MDTKHSIILRDNLIFQGLQEVENEETFKSFFRKELDISEHEVKNNTFSRVHRKSLQSRRKTTGPRPIVARFEHFKQHKQAQSLEKWLKGKPFGIKEQFPHEIVERQKTLLPIFYSSKS